MGAGRRSDEAKMSGLPHNPGYNDVDVTENYCLHILHHFRVQNRIYTSVGWIKGETIVVVCTLAGLVSLTK